MKKVSFILLSFLFTTNAFASDSQGLAAALSAKTNVSVEEAGEQIEDVFAALTSELQEGREVGIKNFGKFFVKARDARVGRNPKTGQPLNIPAKKYPRFSSSDNLKKAMNVEQNIEVKTPAVQG